MSPKPSNGWIEKINRSTFFLVAVLLHLLILLIVATWIVFRAVTLPEPPQFAPAYVKTAPVPPQPPTQAGNTVPHEPDIPFSVNDSPVIPNPAAASLRFLPPPVDLTANGPAATGHAPKMPAAPRTFDLSPERRQAIRKTVKNWFPLSEIPNIDDDLHNLKTKPFPIYLAVYADGDWACNNYLSADEIKAGCLPNLAAQMAAWSNGRLGAGEIRPIRIDSPDLLSDPPPFLFFTGHRDFVLTDAEIDNLRKYLQIGGAIWGDSTFAGDGSRFDVAFHREMKRVLPDADIRFEPLDLSHEIFTHGYFPISKVAAGMNYRNDPIEIMNLDGKLAVIYTPNDYGDMMTLLLKPGDGPPAVDGTPPGPDHPLFTPSAFMSSRNYFYRNYEPQSAADVYRLSTNIVVHLLTRFDQELEAGP